MNRVLFVTSECVPFIKTGGLADVCGALPKNFDKTYWDIRVVLPDYTCIPWEYRQNFKFITSFYISTGSYVVDKYVGVFEYEYDGIKYYFIDNEEYFNVSYPYADVKWDMQKFIFFDKAVLSILPGIGFRPDVIHCHDWQTGMIPVYLKNEFACDMFYWGIKTVFTIHNLRFQGVWDVKTFQGLSGLSNYYFTADKLGFGEKGDANMLKGGLVYTDYITTVSPSYSEEIQDSFYGEGLEDLLCARKFDMQGIVNGIDCDIFDPETDPKINTRYSAEDFRNEKVKNKLALQKELGLVVDKKKFVIAMVSRLTDQKGMDLIDYAFDRIVDEFTQVIITGTGDKKYEDMLKYFAWKYPDRVSANIYYSDDLAHKVYAGADAYLMPSLFEPCGLSQLISFRYGTVPIVRETGGLKDTVEPYNEYEKTGTGFSFMNYNGDEMLDTINYAKKIFFERKRDWNQIVERGMRTDFSWNKSAAQYEEIYNYLMGNF